MTPEEHFERMDRQFEFMAAQQAELNIMVQRNSEQIAKHDAQIVQLAEAILSLVGVVDGQSQRTEKRFQELAESQERTDKKFQELAESQRRTDERLNVLINVVERYFSNGHG